MKKLFTERHGGAKPRVSEVLDIATRDGLLNLATAYIERDWFGLSFPDKCPDGFPYAGTDTTRLRGMMNGYRVIWPFDVVPGDPPEDGVVFDLLEFMYEFVAKAEEFDYHSYWRHWHYNYDQEIGRQEFEEAVNRIFERNGMAFELRDGEVIRLASPVLHESLDQSVFNTGDVRLDELLEAAREKFMHRSLQVRREALEKLWDAWERLKTLEVPNDKKESIRRTLDRAATEPLIREKFDLEARELTNIGNQFMIRHTEVGKPPVNQSAHVDYLFHRMFSMIRLLLHATGRGV